MEFKDITVHSYPLLISQSCNWGTPLLLHAVSNKAHNLLGRVILWKLIFIYKLYKIVFGYWSWSHKKKVHAQIWAHTCLQEKTRKFRSAQTPTQHKLMYCGEQCRCAEIHEAKQIQRQNNWHVGLSQHFPLSRSCFDEVRSHTLPPNKPLARWSPKK